ncbi:hypothetical protein ABH37_18335 [Mycobacterium haemophilum]|uniref:Uncharacterized protein n=1 Tax=Mycobacterium haemophilum TaxID=29311 RepID=A0A0I9YEM5_9MYCO|nr:hypothetical protein ABH39_19415 [Mycobacterium haemophilum]KLO38377.1 hypothetical protein ABH38_02835 [Mycobacterium haemophilum]KLO39394.1 hypothetical protein ABH37_18335 [Mycobacterium haemophilum]KLO46215.1 hypothetical protein ABH36_18575 [Mycobacterium haemophilum]
MLADTIGDIDIAVPLDRDGSFEPQTIQGAASGGVLKLTGFDAQFVTCDRCAVRPVSDPWHWTRSFTGGR